MILMGVLTGYLTVKIGCQNGGRYLLMVTRLVLLSIHEAGLCEKESEDIRFHFLIH